MLALRPVTCFLTDRGIAGGRASGRRDTYLGCTAGEHSAISREPLSVEGEFAQALPPAEPKKVLNRYFLAFDDKRPPRCVLNPLD